MRRFLIGLLVIIIIGLSFLLYMTSQGHDLKSLMNTPDTINVQIGCTQPSAAMTTITVANRSNNSYNRVKYKIIYHNRKGEKAGEKTGEFIRTLLPNNSLTKVVVLPLKAKTCECIVVSVD